jgi:hypothetical protein
MTPTRQQQQAVYDFLNRNQSLIWNGKFGWFSNGVVTIGVHSKYDEDKEIHRLRIYPDGKIS